MLSMLPSSQTIPGKPMYFMRKSTTLQENEVLRLIWTAVMNLMSAIELSILISLFNAAQSTGNHQQISHRFLFAWKLDISNPLAMRAVLGVAPRFCHVSSETLSEVKKKIALWKSLKGMPDSIITQSILARVLFRAATSAFVGDPSGRSRSRSAVPVIWCSGYQSLIFDWSGWVQDPGHHYRPGHLSIFSDRYYCLGCSESV